MISRRIIVLIVAAVIVSAGVVYQLARPTEGVDIRLILVHGTDPQKVTVELKCTGTQPAYIYRMTDFPGRQITLEEGVLVGTAVNYTFAEDIIVPPGSEIRITFPVKGGDVTIETLSGELATGGGISVMEGEFEPEWGDSYPVTGYAIPIIFTRAGNEYRHTAAFQSEEYTPE